MDDENQDVWPLGESMIQLQFVIVMVNGLMSKMMDLHSALCGTCKEKTDTEHELEEIKSYIKTLGDQRQCRPLVVERKKTELPTRDKGIQARREKITKNKCIQASKAILMKDQEHQVDKAQFTDAKSTQVQPDMFDTGVSSQVNLQDIKLAQLENISYAEKEVQADVLDYEKDVETQVDDKALGLTTPLSSILSKKISSKSIGKESKDPSVGKNKDEVDKKQKSISSSKKKDPEMEKIRARNMARAGSVVNKPWQKFYHDRIKNITHPNRFKANWNNNNNINNNENINNHNNGFTQGNNESMGNGMNKNNANWRNQSFRNQTVQQRDKQLMQRIKATVQGSGPEDSDKGHVVRQFHPPARYVTRPQIFCPMKGYPKPIHFENGIPIRADTPDNDRDEENRFHSKSRSRSKSKTRSTSRSKQKAGSRSRTRSNTPPIAHPPQQSIKEHETHLLEKVRSDKSTSESRVITVGGPSVEKCKKQQSSPEKDKYRVDGTKWNDLPSRSPSLTKNNRSTSREHLSKDSQGDTDSKNTRTKGFEKEASQNHQDDGARRSQGGPKSPIDDPPRQNPFLGNKTSVEKRGGPSYRTVRSSVQVPTTPTTSDLGFILRKARNESTLKKKGQSSAKSPTIAKVVNNVRLVRSYSRSSSRSRSRSKSRSRPALRSRSVTRSVSRSRSRSNSKTRMTLERSRLRSRSRSVTSTSSTSSKDKERKKIERMKSYEQRLQSTRLGAICKEVKRKQEEVEKKGLQKVQNVLQKDNSKRGIIQRPIFGQKAKGLKTNLPTKARSETSNVLQGNIVTKEKLRPSVLQKGKDSKLDTTLTPVHKEAQKFNVQKNNILKINIKPDGTQKKGMIGTLVGKNLKTTNNSVATEVSVPHIVNDTNIQKATTNVPDTPGQQSEPPVCLKHLEIYESDEKEEGEIDEADNTESCLQAKNESVSSLETDEPTASPIAVVIGGNRIDREKSVKIPDDTLRHNPKMLEINKSEQTDLKTAGNGAKITIEDYRNRQKQTTETEIKGKSIALTGKARDDKMEEPIQDLQPPPFFHDMTVNTDLKRMDDGDKNMKPDDGQNEKNDGLDSKVAIDSSSAASSAPNTTVDSSTIKEPSGDSSCANNKKTLLPNRDPRTVPKTLYPPTNMTNIFEQMHYRRSLTNAPANSHGQSLSRSQGPPRYGTIHGPGLYASVASSSALNQNKHMQMRYEHAARSMVRGYFKATYNHVRQPVNIRVPNPMHGCGRAGGILGDLRGRRPMRGRGRVGGMLAEQTMQDVLDGNAMMNHVDAKPSAAPPLRNDQNRISTEDKLSQETQEKPQQSKANGVIESSVTDEKGTSISEGTVGKNPSSAP